MLTLTSQEIAQYRSQLSNFPEALTALDMIEDCEGEIEDAAISLAIQTGQQPDCSDWLAGLAKRCRVLLCDATMRNALAQGNIALPVEILLNSEECPAILSTPVVIYVLKTGIDDFCEPLSYQIAHED